MTREEITKRSDKIREVLEEYYQKDGPRDVKKRLAKVKIYVSKGYIQAKASELGIKNRDPKKTEIIRSVINEKYKADGPRKTREYLKNEHKIEVSMSGIQNIASEMGIKYERSQKDVTSTATTAKQDVPTSRDWWTKLSPERAKVVDASCLTDYQNVAEITGFDLLQKWPEALTDKGFRYFAAAKGEKRSRAQILAEYHKARRVAEKERTKKSPENSILQRLHKGPWSIPEIAKEFETSEEEAIRLVDVLYRRGHDIVHDRATKNVYLSPDHTQLEALNIDPAVSRKKEILRHVRRIGVVHGTVLGSKYSNPTILVTLYERFRQEEVDFAIHLGDVTAGHLTGKREGELFLSSANPQKQIDYVLAHYPRVETFKTYFVSGTRDLSFKSSKGKGINVVRRICADESRPDLIYRGDLYATFRMRGVRIEAINPGEDYAPYAKSYPLQNILTNIISEEESLAIQTQDEAVIALVGGSHVYDRIKSGNIHGVLVPSIQSLTPYQKGKRKRGFGPVIGACIIELHFDDEWKLKRENGRDGVKIRMIKLKKYQQKDDYKASAKVKLGLDDLEKKVLAFLDQQSRTEGEISREFRVHKTKVWQIVVRLQSEGYQILTPKDAEQADSRQFELRHTLATQFKPLPVKPLFGNRKRIAFVSDTHFGSLDQLVSCVTKFFAVCDEENVDEILHGGDWTAGKFDHPANRQKVFIPGMEGQMQFLVDWWPKLKNGRKTTGIGGNHDDQHGGRDGLDALRKLFAVHRPDVNYLGSTVGTLKLDKTNIELLHPAGGPGYALSYKGQNIIESIIRLNRARKVEEKIHILGLGNWHIYNEQVHSEVIVVCIPCFQQQTRDYMLPKGLDPWIGGLICDVVTDEDGYVTEFATQFIDMAHMAKTPDFPDMPLSEFFARYIDIKAAPQVKS